MDSRFPLARLASGASQDKDKAKKKNPTVVTGDPAGRSLLPDRSHVFCIDFCHFRGISNLFSCVKTFLTGPVAPVVSRPDASLTLHMSSICAHNSLDMSQIDGILES